MDEKDFSEKMDAARLEKIKNFTLFDDTFMSVVFANEPECAEYVLSAILNEEIKITDARAQFEITNIHGSSARLDVKAEDSKKNLFNIEVQRENNGARPRRARRNGSLLDANCKSMGTYGENLPNTYIVFITEEDYWGDGDALYCFNRECHTSKGKVLAFDDGLNIIYVNGAYRGNDKIGDLMHDFSCSNPDDMKIDVLRNSTKHFKQSEKEMSSMCKAMEELNQMVIDHERENFAIELINMNLTDEQIAKASKLSLEKIIEIKKKMMPVAG